MTEARLRVMTWNVWRRFGPRWRDRQPLIADDPPEPRGPRGLVRELGHRRSDPGRLEWEPADNDDRVAQARAVTALATDPRLDGPAPVLLAGDLNAAPRSPVLRPLHDVLVDA